MDAPGTRSASGAAKWRLRLRVVAAVPAGGADFLLGEGGDVDIRFEAVEDGAHGELLSGDDGRAGAGAVVAFADHLDEQVDATAEVGFVAEVEGVAEIAGAPAPVGIFLGEPQAVLLGGVVTDPGPFFHDRDAVLALAGGDRAVDLAHQVPERV